MKKVILAIAMFVIMLTLGCSRVTQENFNKITTEMSSKEVIAILGEPNHSEGVNFAGISGTTSTWENKDSEIDVQFLNDKVIAKYFKKRDGKKINELE